MNKNDDIRKIKFKAKATILLDNDNSKNWHKDTDPKFKKYKGDGKSGSYYNIDLKTRCQLINTIGEIENYEYDFWHVRFEIVVMFCYDRMGFLTYYFFQAIDNELKPIYPEDFIFTKDYIKDVVSKGVFLGNWHDGEEYLLKRIKELSNGF